MHQVIADVRRGWSHLPHGMRGLLALQLALAASTLANLHVVLGEPSLNVDMLTSWFRFHGPSLAFETGEPFLLAFALGRWARRKEARERTQSERTEEPHCACCVSQ